MHVLYNVTTGDDESDEELEFDVNTDPVTDSNQCEDCIVGLNSSAIEYNDNNTGDLSLVSMDLQIVVCSESGIDEEVDNNEVMEIEEETDVNGGDNNDDENGSNCNDGDDEPNDSNCNDGDDEANDNNVFGDSDEYNNGEKDNDDEANDENSNSDSSDDEANNSINDIREIDLSEKRKVECFVQNGCGCTLNVRIMCSSIFSMDHISSVRNQCSLFERSELNNILLGHIMATVRTSDMTVGHGPTTRVRNTTCFYHEGQKVTLIT